MQRNRVNLITLAARDVSALVSFYKAIGWVVELEETKMVAFDLGGQKLGLYDRASLANDLGRDAASLGMGAVTLGQNFEDKAAVNAAYDTAIAAGATVCKRPEDIFWGGYSGTWADPEGHIWEYAWNPFWPLTDDGRLA